MTTKLSLQRSLVDKLKRICHQNSFLASSSHKNFLIDFLNIYVHVHFRKYRVRSWITGTLILRTYVRTVMIQIVSNNHSLRVVRHARRVTPSKSPRTRTLRRWWSVAVRGAVHRVATLRGEEEEAYSTSTLISTWYHANSLGIQDVVRSAFGDWVRRKFRNKFYYHLSEGTSTI